MKVEKVVVVGSGTMGNGIAQVCAQKGLSVLVCDLNQEILDKAIKFEETGMAFFKERAGSAPSQLERNLFTSLAKDEAGHKAHLVKMREDVLRENSLEVLPDVSDEDVEKELDQLREQAARYDPVEPRPTEKGEHATLERT